MSLCFGIASYIVDYKCYAGSIVPYVKVRILNPNVTQNICIITGNYFTTTTTGNMQILDIVWSSMPWKYVHFGVTIYWYFMNEKGKSASMGIIWKKCNSFFGPMTKYGHKEDKVAALVV